MYRMDYVFPWNSNAADPQFDAQPVVYNYDFRVDRSFSVADESVDRSQNTVEKCSRRVFVARVSFDTTPEDLLVHFGAFGEVTDVYCPKDPYHPSFNKGFGFVSFKFVETAERVLLWAPHVINGREVVVDFAVERSDEESHAATLYKKPGGPPTSEIAPESGKPVDPMGSLAGRPISDALTIASATLVTNRIECVVKMKMDSNASNHLEGSPSCKEGTHDSSREPPVEINLYIPMKWFEKSCNGQLPCHLSLWPTTEGQGWRRDHSNKSRISMSYAYKPEEPENVHILTSPNNANNAPPSDTSHDLDTSNGLAHSFPIATDPSHTFPRNRPLDNLNHWEGMDPSHAFTPNSKTSNAAPHYTPSERQLLPNGGPTASFNAYPYHYNNATRLRKAPPGGNEWTRKGHRIHVGQLKPLTTADQLKSYFEQFGEVVDAYIPKDPALNCSRRFGFVTFLDPTIVSNLTSSPHQFHEINGEKVTVSKAYVL